MKSVHESGPSITRLGLLVGVACAVIFQWDGRPHSSALLAGPAGRPDATNEYLDSFRWLQVEQQHYPEDAVDRFRQTAITAEYRAKAEAKLDEIRWRQVSIADRAKLSHFLTLVHSEQYRQKALGALDTLDWVALDKHARPAVLEFSKQARTAKFRRDAGSLLLRIDLKERLAGGRLGGGYRELRWGMLAEEADTALVRMGLRRLEKRDVAEGGADEYLKFAGDGITVEAYFYHGLLWYVAVTLPDLSAERKLELLQGKYGKSEPLLDTDPRDAYRSAPGTCQVSKRLWKDEVTSIKSALEKGDDSRCDPTRTRRIVYESIALTAELEAERKAGTAKKYEDKL